MAAHRVTSIALVGAQAQPVELTLWLQMKAAILSVDLLPHPVLQLHKQTIVPLLAQAVDVFQAQPVLIVYVAKPFLQGQSKEKLMLAQ